MAMGKFVNLSGRTIGRLVVTEAWERRPYKPGGPRRTFWLCRCECGQEKYIGSDQLVNGTTQSCGCLRSELSSARRTKHGKSGTREHRIWKGIRRRCYDQRATGYADYGGRGIRMCRRWRTANGFENFLADMGACPSSRHSLDRYPDNDGHYEPSNCRWATRLEQGRNSRKNHMITHNGSTHPLSVWAELTGIRAGTIGMRLAKGWSVHDALTVPVLRRR